MEVQVRKGDTLWQYSRIFKVPLKLLIDANPDVQPNQLTDQEMIKIPGYRALPYTIQTGETLFGIASHRKQSVDQLLLINQQQDPQKLLMGKTILLPERMQRSDVSTLLPCDSNWVETTVSELEEAYPFIKVQLIGESVLRKPIREVCIGSGSRKIHMNASFHANEWITTVVLLKLLDHYLFSLVNGTSVIGHNAIDLYKRTTLSIVPMVNPDGADLVQNGPPEHLREALLAINKGNDEFVHWKANIHGVDLNKQYPANWEIDQKRKAPKGPAPRDYPGIAPLTEPEAVTMAELVKNNHYDCILAFHTQGEEFYWGYEGLEPIESARMAQEFEQRSGYQAIRYVDSHAGYKDWFIQEFRRPGFTIELGKGINPLPLSQLDKIMTNVAGIFFSALSF